MININADDVDQPEPGRKYTRLTIGSWTLNPNSGLSQLEVDWNMSQVHCTCSPDCTPQPCAHHLEEDIGGDVVDAIVH